VNRQESIGTDIPPTLTSPGAVAFWAVVVLTGAGAGVGAVVLTLLLQYVQHVMWPGATLIEGVSQTSAGHHVAVLVGAGLLTGAGQILLRRLTSGNGIDITEAISDFAGRLPALRTLGSAVLSILVVGMGASLGREGAPKQVGAVLANALSDRARLSDEQRRLLVACGAGAGMAAAYGVPLGGALFALEVLRGVLALRLILPALLASGIAAGVAWIVLPNAPTYVIPSVPWSASVIGWTLLAGPIAGLVSIGYVHLVAWADHNRPSGWRRLVAPVAALGLLGLAAIEFPQLLGNGRTSPSSPSPTRSRPGCWSSCWCCGPCPPSCVWAAVCREVCSPPRWRWARCSAGSWDWVGRGCGPGRHPGCLPSWEPPRCWRQRPTARYRPSS